MTTAARPLTTPGPWSVSDLGDDQGYIVHPVEVVVAGRPDAHLIAAAPELYEALNRAANELELLYRFAINNGIPEANLPPHVLARAALARADVSKTAHLHVTPGSTTRTARSARSKRAKPRVTCFCGGEHITGWCLFRANDR